MSQTPSSRDVPEFTLRAVLCGLVFGALFGAANAYLGLKAGLTVSTSIPIAVLSVAAFRWIGARGDPLLEANMSQTIGSASSSLASGTIFTIPALFMWGMEPSLVQVAALAACGGVLGILAMVPLRRLLIAQAGGDLPYPEGRACADVLQATRGASNEGRWVFAGLALGAAVKLAISWAHVAPDEIAFAVPALPNGSLALRIAPALLAVGYIVGFRASSVMVAGSLVTALVLLPLATKAHLAGGESAIARLIASDAGRAVDPGAAAGASVALGAKAVKDAFLTFMGAGAVAAAGAVTVVRTAPTMARSLAAVWAGVRKSAVRTLAERTDRDLPAGVIVGGVAAVVLVLAIVPGIFAGEMPWTGRAVAALGVAVFAFVFVPVSSRLVGLIGVSSNPTSAMALITLTGTAAAFLALGWTGELAKAAVLTVGTVVCVAASKAGDISQDLKTGWLVGGTPVRQQAGQLLAAGVACWAVAGAMLALGYGEGFGEHGLQAPQAKLMKTVVETVLGEELPWDLLLGGAALSLIGTLAGLPALPFALGIYLPLATMAAVFAGGVIRKLTDRGVAAGAADRGILCASGLVAGEGLAGVAVAGYAFATGAVRGGAPAAPVGFELALGLALLAAAAALIAYAARRSRPR
jgi:OPT family oligopeptide transporter